MAKLLLLHDPCTPAPRPFHDERRGKLGTCTERKLETARFPARNLAALWVTNLSLNADAMPADEQISCQFIRVPDGQQPAGMNLGALWRDRGHIGGARVGVLGLGTSQRLWSFKMGSFSSLGLALVSAILLLSTGAFTTTPFSPA